MSAKKGENICPKQTVWSKKIPGKLFGNLLGKRFMRVYVRKNFPPTGQKIIACGSIFVQKKKPGKPFYGLLGLNTVYELPAGQLFFFPAVTFCGRCAILPKRNGKNFRRVPPKRPDRAKCLISRSTLLSEVMSQVTKLPIVNLFYLFVIKPEKALKRCVSSKVADKVADKVAGKVAGKITGKAVGDGFFE